MKHFIAGILKDIIIGMERIVISATATINIINDMVFMSLFFKLYTFFLF